MLIWITAPCVAIGVFAAFLLLVSSVTSEDVVVSTVEAPSVDEQPLTHLPFADRLRNTCDLQNGRTSSSSVSVVGHRAHFEREFLKHIRDYVNFTKRSALLVLNNHTISNCATLHISNLPHTPTLVELQEMDIKEALNKVYSSLLVHSGYSYFISHQIVSSETRCSEDAEAEQMLADLSRELAEKQRFLACRLQLGMKMLGYTMDDVSSVLNERISNLSQCSLRLLRDCQVMKSVNNFLQVLTEYLSDYIDTSTTSLPTLLRTVL